MMVHFFREVWDLLINIGALFLWVPIVWLLVKGSQWKQSESDKFRDESELEARALVKTQPWKGSPAFWSRALAASDEPEASGDFYVVAKECLNCGAPAESAPDLIRHHFDGSSGGSCFFIKQPSTPGEIDQAVAAVTSSCVCAVRYRGNDASILVRLSPMSVDHPFTKRLPS
jgi:hypothetical protein